MAHKQKLGKIVSIDLGLLDPAITADGNEFKHYPNSRSLKRGVKKLRKLNKELSRRVKWSKNRCKTVAKLSRCHFRIAQIRLQTLHHLTTRLVRNYEFIVIEDLNVEGTMKNARLSQAIADVGWGELRRQLEYKSEWFGSSVILAPRFYPSSKLCSNCGERKDDLILTDRFYKCDSCGFEVDRDDNAAATLREYGLIHLTTQYSPIVAGSWTETINACREHVRPLEGYSLKQSVMNVPNDGGNVDEA